MNLSDLASLAEDLDHSRLFSQPRERLTAAYPDLALADGYKIQREGIKIRVDRGEKVIGYKMGLTSKAKMEQVKLSSPIYGVLIDSALVKANGPFSLSKSIHPKIEPEIAFVMGKDLSGKVSEEEALDACEYACGALEIIDSRFLHFKYFSLPDVVADNCSAGYFALGPVVKNPKEIKLAELEMKMKVNGQLAQKAFSNSILGNPIQSVVQLCWLLHQEGLGLIKGQLVLAGAATQALALEPSMKVELSIQDLGSFSLMVTE